MEALVGDYTRPGDLVCDPTAGFGVTLSAALKMGRTAIGSEMDVEAFDVASRTLAGLDPRPRIEQPGLFGGAQ